MDDQRAEDVTGDRQSARVKERKAKKMGEQSSSRDSSLLEIDGVFSPKQKKEGKALARTKATKASTSGVARNESGGASGGGASSDMGKEERDIKGDSGGIKTPGKEFGDDQEELGVLNFGRKSPASGARVDQSREGMIEETARTDGERLMAQTMWFGTYELMCKESELRPRKEDVQERWLTTMRTMFPALGPDTVADLVEPLWAATRQGVLSSPSPFCARSPPTPPRTQIDRGGALANLETREYQSLTGEQGGAAGSGGGGGAGSTPTVAMLDRMSLADETRWHVTARRGHQGAEESQRDDSSYQDSAASDTTADLSEYSKDLRQDEEHWDRTFQNKVLMTNTLTGTPRKFGESRQVFALRGFGQFERLTVFGSRGTLAKDDYELQCLEEVEQVAKVVEEHELSCEFTTALVLQLIRVGLGWRLCYTQNDNREEEILFRRKLRMEDEGELPDTPERWNLIDQLQAAQNAARLFGMMYGPPVRDSMLSFADWLLRKCNREVGLGRDDFEYWWQDRTSVLFRFARRQAEVMTAALQTERGVTLQVLSNHASKEAMALAKRHKLEFPHEHAFGKGGRKAVETALQEEGELAMKQMMAQARGARRGQEVHQAQATKTPTSGGKAEGGRKQARASKTWMPESLRPQVLAKLQKACVVQLAKGKCDNAKCKFKHTTLSESVKSSDEARLATLHLLDLPVDEQEEEARMLIGSLSGTMTRASGWRAIPQEPNDVLAASEGSGKVNEDYLMREKEHARERAEGTAKPPASNMVTPWCPIVGLSVPENARMSAHREADSLLVRRYPAVKRLESPLRSLLVARAAHVMTGGEKDVGKLFNEGLRSLHASSREGARIAADFLRRESGKAKALVECMHVGPHAVWDREHLPGMSVLALHDDKFDMLDHGDQLLLSSGERRGQCVILTLAQVLTVTGEQLHRGLEEQFQQLVNSWKDATHISEEQRRVMVCLHDMQHAVSHDLGLVLYAPELFKYVQIVVVSMTSTDSPNFGVNLVTVLQNKGWNRREGRTCLVATCQGHALTMSLQSKTREVCVPGRVGNVEADALLRSWKGKGIQVTVEESVGREELKRAKRDIRVADMRPCPCGCGAKLVRGEATRASGGHQCPGALWTGHGRGVQDTYIKNYLEQTYSEKNIEAMSAGRSEDYKRYAILTQGEVKALKTSPEEDATVEKYLLDARTMLAALDRSCIKKDDQAEVAKAGAMVWNLAEQGTELVRLCGSSRRAVALLRKEVVKQDGRVSTCPEAVDELSYLLTHMEHSVLRRVCDSGILLGEYKHMVGQEVPVPNKLESGVHGDTWWSAIQDTAKGGALVFTAGALEHVDEAVFHTMLAVPKTNDLGQPTGEQRSVVDMRVLSEHVARTTEEAELHGVSFTRPDMNVGQVTDMLYNMHHVVSQNPNVPILLSLIDINQAFKNALLNVADANSTGMTLPQPAEGEGKELMLQLLSSTPMGFISSPADHDRLSSILKAMLIRVDLPEEDKQMLAAMQLLVGHFVDDTGLLLVAIGGGPEYYVEAANKLMMILLGKEAWNFAKNGAAAVPTLLKKQWGFNFDVTEVAEKGMMGVMVSVPDNKIEKALFLFRGLADSLGSKDLLLNDVSAASGLGNWMSVACMGLKELLPFLYRMMSSQDEDMVRLHGPTWLQEQTWLSFAWGVHEIILLLLDYANSGSNVPRVLMGGMLTAAQMEDMGVPSHWLVLDASGGASGQLGGVLWHSQQYVVGFVSEYAEKLDRVVGKLDRRPGYEDIPTIMIGEMVAFMVTLFAFLEGLEEGDGTLRVVKVLTDNQGVWRSMMGAKSANPQSQWLITQALRLAFKYNIKFEWGWVSTEHNDLADMLSRHADLPPEELQARVEVLAPGLKRLDDTSFLEYLKAAEEDPRGQWGLPGEARREEVEEEMRRYELQVLQFERLGGDAEPVSRYSVSDVHGGIPTTVEAWRSMGLDCRALVESDGAMRELAVLSAKRQSSEVMATYPSLAEYCKVSDQEQDCVLLHCLPPSLSGDLEAAIKVVLKVLKVSKPKVLAMIFAPSHWEKGALAWEKALQLVGYARCRSEVEEARLEPGVSISLAEWKPRCAVHFELKVMKDQLGPFPALVGRLGNKATRGKDVIRAPVSNEGNREGEFTPHVFRRDVGRARVLGFFKRTGTGEEAGVGWRVKLEASGEELEVINCSRARIQVLGRNDSRSQGQWVSRGEPVWAMGPGVTVTSLEGPCMPLTERKDQEVYVWETRGTEEPYCRLLTAEEKCVIHSGNDDRARHLVEETKALGKVSMLGKASPIPLMEAMGARMALRLDDYSALRCSGGQRWKRTMPQDKKEVTIEVPTLKELDDWGKASVREGLAVGTVKAYESGCKHWLAFGVEYQVSPLLDGQSQRQREMIQIRFISWLRHVKQFKSGTIGGIQSAVVWLHTINGAKHPFAKCGRAALCLKSFRKEEGGVRTQKLPVDIDMLEGIVEGLDLEVWDQALLATALMLGFVFLLRGGEMLRKGSKKAVTKTLMVSQVRFLRGGVEVLGNSVDTADEMMITIGSSKTDQTANGISLSSAISNHALCPARLIMKLRKLNPGHFEGVDKCLLTKEDGSVLHRDVVEKVLKQEGKQRGRLASDYGVHSLRIGGTTKMWSEGYSAEDIKIRGRWASECWRRYVWGGQDRNGKLTDNLLKAGPLPLALHVK